MLALAADAKKVRLQAATDITSCDFDGIIHQQHLGTPLGPASIKCSYSYS